MLLGLTVGPRFWIKVSKWGISWFSPPLCMPGRAPPSHSPVNIVPCVFQPTVSPGALQCCSDNDPLQPHQPWTSAACQASWWTILGVKSPKEGLSGRHSRTCWTQDLSDSPSNPCWVNAAKYSQDKGGKFPLFSSQEGPTSPFGWADFSGRTGCFHKASQILFSGAKDELGTNNR